LIFRVNPGSFALTTQINVLHLVFVVSQVDDIGLVPFGLGVVGTFYILALYRCDVRKRRVVLGILINEHVVEDLLAAPIVLLVDTWIEVRFKLLLGLT
tara:strand:- start:163 stop:456 length:294 start_codon:yes stop_codon:yes gene_type:complete